MASVLSLEEADALLAALGADASPLLLTAGSASPSNQASPHADAASNAEQSSPRSNAASKNRGHRVLTTRERERQELRFLRVHCKELIDRLSTLRSSILFAKPLPGRQALWRHLARRRLADRHRAERENHQLRQQLAQQLELAQMWHDRMSREEREVVADAIDEDDRKALDQFISELDAAYALVDAVFADQYDPTKMFKPTRGIFDPLNPVWQAGLINTDSDSPGAELCDERLIPFDFPLVMDAVWQSWVLWHVGGKNVVSSAWSGCFEYSGIDRPEHTFALKFRLKVATPDKSFVYMNEKIAVRRYLEADRLVLVWRGSSEGENEFLGYSTDETGWIVVERAPTPTATASSSHAKPRDQAVMRSYARLILKCAGGCSRKMRDTMLQLVIRSYQEDVSFIFREMETMLLRVSLEQR